MLKYKCKLKLPKHRRTRHGTIDQEYVVDSFPVPVCENIRIFHSKIYKEEKYRGYQANKKRYFYGIKVHMVVTTDGKPIEFILSPGSCSDIKGFELKVALLASIPSFMVLAEAITI